MKTEDIERFINNEMDESERRSFEMEIQHNASLAKEVQQMREVIEQLKFASLSAKIRDAQKLNQKAAQTKKYLIIGLISLLAVATLYFFFRQNENPATFQSIEENPVIDTVQIKNLPVTDSLNAIQSPETKQPELKPKKRELPMAEIKQGPENNKGRELALNAYSLPEELVYVRGTTLESWLDSAKLAINDEQYSKALQYLNHIQETSLKSDYFKAHVYFNLGQFNRAGKIFENILKNERSQEMKNEIEWYLLLNYISCGSDCKEKADKLYAKIIQNPEHNFYKPANNLKNKIDQTRNH